MNIIYFLSELLATFIEGLTALFVAGSLAVPKYERKKHVPFIVMLSVIYTAFITLMNKWESFSFVTLAAAIVYTFLVLLFLSSGDLLQKATSSMVAWFFIVAIDYVLTYSLIMIIGRSLDISKGFAIIMQPGKIRVAFILTDKLLQALIFILCRKLYPKLHTFNRRNQTLILVISTFSYIVMQILMGFAVSDSVLTLQIAVIFSLFFFIFAVIVSVLAISFSAEYQAKKTEAELMALSNAMLEKNYSEMRTAQKTIARQVHDFKNHLLTISGMIEKDESAKDYIENLVGQVYAGSNLCSCGNDTIDSIVNCKMNEARSNGISFDFYTDIKTAVDIPPVDLCSILANQLDNAIEACMKIEETDKRHIELKITQNNSILLFKVSNTVNENPFKENSRLKSTKNDDSGIHGYGIKNIKSAAEKHNGMLENEYINGCFVSSVVISGINKSK